MREENKAEETAIIRFKSHRAYLWVKTESYAR